MAISNHNATMYPMMVPDAFSKAECDSLIRICKKEGAPGKLQSGAGTDTDPAVSRDTTVRRSSIARIGRSESGWLFERMRSILSSANQTFGYDMSNGAIEDLQIAAYSAKNRGTYGWHMDMGPGVMTRKFGISVPLNKSEDYEGGELQFNYGRTEIVEQKLGQAIVFPSFVMHRVTQVTKGVRFSLVAWAHGPPFR